MHIGATDDYLEEEEGILLAFLELGGFVDDRSNSEGLPLLFRPSELPILSDGVCLFCGAGDIPALNGCLIVSVVKVNARLVELLNLEAVGK